MTERRPPDDPADEPDEDDNPEFDRFEALTKRVLRAKPGKRGVGGTVRHFTQTNGLGLAQDNVPALLRRVADTIEGLGEVTVYGITFGISEMTEDGPMYELTVYFNYADEPEP